MKKNLKPGHVSVLAVLVLSTVLLLMLTASFRFSIQNQETQKQSQLRIDYTNREQALLRAILTEASNSAVQNMMANSNGAGWEVKSRWRWVFENGRIKADGETALERGRADVLGISATAISGNTGDGSQDHIKYAIDAVREQPSNHWFYLNAGINGVTSLLGEGFPEALVLADSSLELLDRDRPIISIDKTYSDGSQFKLIPYPNVRFGYGAQGQDFLAKRNWWAFSITYGSQSENITGVETETKDYVLSIYEVPSQLGLGSSASTLLGKHDDGTVWGGISITGGVYARRAAMEGTLSLERIAASKGITLDIDNVVGGVRQDDLTGDLPSREAYQAAHSNFFPLSNSADSGLVAFLPITRGEEGFDDLSDTTDSNSASTTGWNYYSRPAVQCVMKLRVEDVVSPTDQTPTSISFTYMMGGIEKTETFTRGNNWPSEGTEEGANFPFHVASNKVGRRAISVHIGRLATYLKAVGADSLEINNSIAINANYRDNLDIMKPNIPSLESDISLILRDSKDFTDFPKGFSIVSPFRLYFANDVNIVSNGVDASGKETFPPISLFTPEKRFGVRNEAQTIDLRGQVNHVGKDDGSQVRIMDFISGSQEQVVANNINAELHAITDASQLPPINQMNWLVVIQEVE